MDTSIPRGCFCYFRVLLPENPLEVPPFSIYRMPDAYLLYCGCCYPKLEYPDFIFESKGNLKRCAVGHTTRVKLRAINCKAVHGKCPKIYHPFGYDELELERISLLLTEGNISVRISNIEDKTVVYCISSDPAEEFDGNFPLAVVHPTLTESYGFLKEDRLQQTMTVCQNNLATCFMTALKHHTRAQQQIMSFVKYQSIHEIPGTNPSVPISIEKNGKQHLVTPFWKNGMEVMLSCHEVGSKLQLNIRGQMGCKMQDARMLKAEVRTESDVLLVANQQPGQTFTLSTTLEQTKDNCFCIEFNIYVVVGIFPKRLIKKVFVWIS